MRTIVLSREDGRSDYGPSIDLSDDYEYFVGEKKEFIHAKEGNFQRYLCYYSRSPYGWDRCENYLFEPNFPVPAIPLEVCLYGTDEMHSMVYISDSDNLVCWWDFNWDRCMDFGYEVGEYATEIKYH